MCVCVCVYIYTYKKNIEMHTNILSFKVVVMGDSGVGKSALLNRFVYNRFNRFICRTIFT